MKPRPLAANQQRGAGKRRPSVTRPSTNQRPRRARSTQGPPAVGRQRERRCARSRAGSVRGVAQRLLRRSAAPPPTRTALLGNRPLREATSRGGGGSDLGGKGGGGFYQQSRCFSRSWSVRPSASSEARGFSGRTASSASLEGGFSRRLFSPRHRPAQSRPDNNNSTLAAALRGQPHTGRRREERREREREERRALVRRDGVYFAARLCCSVVVVLGASSSDVVFVLCAYPNGGLINNLTVHTQRKKKKKKKKKQTRRKDIYHLVSDSNCELRRRGQASLPSLVRRWDPRCFSPVVSQSTSKSEPEAISCCFR